MTRNESSPLVGARTVIGIDWASEEVNRALVVLGPGITIDKVAVGPSNNDADIWKPDQQTVIAVDIPFGWPTEFCKFLESWKPCPNESTKIEELCDLHARDKFWYRKTEQVVARETLRRPLVLPRNRFASGAYAWANVCTKHGLGSQIDVFGELRDVDGPTIIEVYPAATLAVLATPDGPLKECLFRSKRDRIKASASRKAVSEILGKQFNFNWDYDSEKDKGFHVFDALLAALTGLMYLHTTAGAPLESTPNNQIADWQVRKPESQEEKAAAEKEGWIFFPKRYP